MKGLSCSEQSWLETLKSPSNAKLPSLQAAHEQVDSLLSILHSAIPSQDTCEMGLCKGDFIMPTLNGWLLGYPVVYLVDEATVGATADHLSSRGVERHIVMAPNPALKV